MTIPGGREEESVHAGSDNPTYSGCGWMILLVASPFFRYVRLDLEWHAHWLEFASQFG